MSVCKDLELMGELRTVCGCSSSGEAEPPYESPCLGPHHREQCACTKELEPQCDRGGKEIAPNRCVAECMGYEQWQVNMYHCGSIPVSACFHSHT